MKYVVITNRTTGETKLRNLTDASRIVGMCPRTMADWKDKVIKNDIGTNVRNYSKWTIHLQVDEV